MSARLLAVLVAGVAVAFVVVSPAFASLADEVSAGKALAAELQSGKAECDAVSHAQFEHLGECAMERMVGSRTAHEAMNDRMAGAIGIGNTDRMHELMGRRFTGCAGGAAAAAPMGPGMMGGSGWGWMQNGSSQHMSRSDWRQLAGTMMGSRYTSGHHGWSTGAVLAVVLATGLLVALVAVLLVRRPWHRGPPTAPHAA